jgi:AcrR family transcriptional regulator
MAPTTTNPTEQSTKQRLLEAAEEIFAAKGFDAASVEEITKRAGANRAAISFHFGGKERLYIETVIYANRNCLQGEPFPDWPPGTPAEERLRGFVRTMVLRMMREHKPASTQIMMREMAQPTQACVEVVRDYIRPTANVLLEILNDMLPPTVPPERRYLLGFSIASQYLFYRQNRPIAALLMGEEAFQQLDPEQITEHIYTVARAAIAAEASRERKRPEAEP